MTTHEMSLNPIPFEAIQNTSQLIETRIYDDKRRLIQVGDTITFYQRPERENHFAAQVIGLSIFDTFINLFSAIDEIKFGYEKGTTPKIIADNMQKYYTHEKKQQLGVLGIHLKLI